MPGFPPGEGAGRSHGSGDAASRPSAFTHRWLPFVLLLLLVIVTYRDLPSHSFLTNWDDPGYVTNNPAVRGVSLGNVRLAFTRFFEGNYAPVQIVSYMLDYSLWGLKPAGFLLTNVLCHASSGILLYLLLLRTGVSRWGAFLGSSLFLVHPVQVESVAWISQRKNLLAMVFFLLALHAYLSCREERDGGLWYGASLLAFTLSLLSKAVGVIFPLVLLMYDLLLCRRRRLLREHADKIPFFAVAAIAGAVAVVAQSPEYGGGRVAQPENALVALPLTMLPVLVAYLRLLAWPAPSHLSLIYDPPLRGTVDGEVLLAACGTCFLIFAGIVLWRKAKPSFFWYLLFFVGLLPVSQFVQLMTIMNDRYLYFPLLGVAGLMGLGWDRLMVRVPRAAGRWGAPVAVTAVLLLATGSHGRSRVWKDSVTLFMDTVPKVPTMHDPWFMLAQAYEAAGDGTTARLCYDRASLPGPLDPSDYYRLGQIYLDRGEHDKAYEYARWLQGSGVPPEMRRDPEFVRMVGQFAEEVR